LPSLIKLAKKQLEQEDKEILKIKFSHDYAKLPENWEGTQAGLIGIQIIPDMDNWKKRFPQLIAVDTMFRGEEGHYELNFKEGILLFFIHLNTARLFTTIRRYTPYKQEYYENNIFKSFTMVRLNETRR